LPELPEVETLRRGLERHLVGKTITGGRVVNNKILAGTYVDAEQFLGILSGKIVESVDRRGKHLIFRLNSGYHLLFHLKMRGQILVVPHEEADQKYLTVSLEFDDCRDLRFYDMWTWGEARLLTTSEFESHTVLEKMGVEPLSDDFTPLVLEDSLKQHPRTRVKAALLDQTVVAGVGNIYADESLYSSGILPERTADSLTRDEIGRLTEAIKQVLSQATEAGGTQSDNYVDADGTAGAFVPRVYGRGGEPCLRCGNKLAKIKVVGRGTVYCSVCQS